MKNILQNFKDLDGLIIASCPNVFYLTGFRSSFGFLIMTEKENFLVTDSRYFLRAKKCAGFTPVLFDADFANNFGNKFEGEFGIEDSVRFSALENFQKWFPNVHFATKKSPVAELRRSKKEEEIERIKTAVKRVDDILVPTVKKHLKLGVTEKQVAWELEKAIRAGGEFAMSFDPIVAFGSNSAISHHETGERRLQKNENVLIDIGAKFQNYCSDITRNFFFGTPSPEYLNVYEKLKLAQEATVSKFKTGAKVKNLELFCREELEKLAKNFMHSLGHGVGIQIHEMPKISIKSDDILLKNEVVTCEPGVYFEEKFGIRIEDMVLVKDGKPEILTKTERELVVI